MPYHPGSQRIKTLAGLRYSAPSLIAQAVGILTRYGGSLWLADPAYTFTGSDGTGAAGDNSDTGYVRDLCGNARPLTQATTGFKPKLKRVPKRLGAELVTNGDFAAGSTGWSGVTPGASFTGGVFNIVSTNGEYQGAAQSGIVQTGKTYVVQADVVINSGGGGVAIATAGASVAQATTGKLYGTLTATASNIDVKRSTGTVNATVDNVSVREVIEWGWAWVFDGVDDLLATVSQPAITGETFLVAAKITTASTANFHPLMSKREGTNNGSYIRREQTSGTTVAGVAEAGGAFPTATIRANDTDLTAQVYGQKITGSQTIGRRNGVQVNATACTPSPSLSPVRLAAVTSFRMQGEIFAAAYAPVAIPDAELLIIERAMAQLAGVTI